MAGHHHNNKMTKRDLMIRLICGLLALLMIGSIAYTVIAYLFFG